MRDPEVMEAVRRVVDRVAAAAERAGRDPAEVRVVAVTKGVEAVRAQAALEAGVSELGENRAQELWTKARSVSGPVRWHYLGALQTNKVAYLDQAHLIHGFWRLREAAALQARGERIGRAWEVLVQVNLSGEAAKQGVRVAEAEDLLSRLDEYPLVRARGFMFMAPRTENAEDVRWIFKEGKDLRDRFGLEELSMGMSDDFEIAIEEGATIVRIGRAIFGPRSRTLPSKAVPKGEKT